MQPRIPSSGRGRWALASIAVMAIAAGAGCSKISGPEGAKAWTPAIETHANVASISPVVESNGTEPPAGLVSVPYEGENLSFWPYTGASYNGVPSDPINLIFTGCADPRQIRAALLALDGDRTAFGLPPVAPFNSRWSDAMGDVQTAYASTGRWDGSVIQLALGGYGPVRFHLRLFRTGQVFGSQGSWTLGGAHFEVLIPGTTEHQVLSWELAQQLVVIDLIRSGLLKPGTPPLSGPINQAPSFREIPDVVYNLLPGDLIALLQQFGAPAQPVSGPVPIPSDGQATILDLVQPAAVAAGSTAQNFTVEFGQAIPKPLCSDGPYDWVFVTGPVEFTETASVDDAGRYEYNSRVAGHLTVTPVDITTQPPTPVGASYAADVSDVQSGVMDAGTDMVQMKSKRLAPQKGGAETLMIDLKAGSTGPDRYRASSQCLQP
jgi:hypothetical protein